MVLLSKMWRERSMLWLKSCPRCGGDVYEDRGDDRGDAIYFLECLQCGHILSDSEERKLNWITVETIEPQDAFV
jgi:hypothetical protein